MAQVCTQCGAPITEGYRFCSNCGAVVGSVPTTEAPPPPPAAVEGGATDAPEGVVPMPMPSAPTLYGPQVPPPPPDTARPARSATFRPDAKEGGMYVPYGVDAEAELAKRDQTPSRSRMLPVVIIAGLLLLALGGVAAWLMLNPGPNTVVSNCNLPASPTEEDRVKQVVCISNEEQIKAWRNLDTEVLRGSRTGPVLEENIAFVEDLKRRNLYAVPVLQSLDIKEVKIDGDTATVSTIETWSVTFHNRGDNAVVETNGPDTLAETYYMVKRDGKWLVERLDFGENP